MENLVTMMKRLVLALLMVCLLTLLPFKVAMADDSSLEGEAIVLLGLEVAASLPTAYSISNEAQATGREGEAIPISGDSLSLQVSGGKAGLTLPIALSEGQTLTSFTDPVSGLELSGNELTIPLKDPSGNQVMSIVFEIDEIKGDGDTTEVVAKKVTLKSTELGVDLSQDDDKAGQVSASFEVDLKSLPPDASINISISQHPDEDVLTSFELVAMGDGNVVADIACTLSVEKTNLENGIDLGEAIIIMKVGQAWVERYGVDNVQIMRHSEEGEGQVLPTTFIRYEGEQAIFQAASPGGLSVFGLAALIPLSSGSAIWIPIVGGIGGSSSISAFLVLFVLRRRRAREAALRRRWPTGMRPEDWEA